MKSKHILSISVASLVLTTSLLVSVYIKKTTEKTVFLAAKNREAKVVAKRKISEERLNEILSSHNDKVFGFDVSEYQGNINWEKATNIREQHPLKFVFIRATAGNNRVDKKFKDNWAKAKETNMVRGAYHYYRPDEAPEYQAKQFIAQVKLLKGDFPPVLDIERQPRRISMGQLKSNLKKWLAIVEKHYGVKPIIYTGEAYHRSFLKKDFKDYKFWIANYNPSVSYLEDHWLAWQFTDTATINGVVGHVDLNVFHGNQIALLAHTIQD